MGQLDDRGLVFLDDNSRPFWCRTWGGEPWLFCLSADQKWVSLRKVNQADVLGMPDNLTEKEQDMYRDFV